MSRGSERLTRKDRIEARFGSRVLDYLWKEDKDTYTHRVVWDAIVHSLSREGFLFLHEVRQIEAMNNEGGPEDGSSTN